ncbi:MAG: class I adenylate-forming enzyme family protein [Pigmentiphaga sp.]
MPQTSASTDSTTDVFVRGNNAWHRPLYAAFEEQVARTPHATALQWGESSRTYAELACRSTRLAAALRARGVARGDRIAMLSENRSEYVEMMLAAALLGATAACQNWRLTPAELSHCVAVIRPKLIMVSERFAPVLQQLPAISVFSLGAEYEYALARAASAPPSAGQAEDGLLILYTSGTTGLPKAAVISQRALLARSYIQAVDRPTDPSAAFIAWTPFFHMGATDPALGTLTRGGKVVLVDGYQPQVILHTVQHDHVGHLTVVPGVAERFLRALVESGCTPRRVDVVGAMPDLIAPRVVAELTRRLNAPFCNTFGSTETGSPPASKGLIDIGVVPTDLAKTQNSLCEVRLVDDAGHEAGVGVPGEVVLRGPSLFSGYWEGEEVNAQVFRNGWYRMGDVFLRRPDGCLEFVDRKKYLIKSGGENIYPAEIERAILSLDGVAEVVVVRRPDETWGEVPVAFIVKNDPKLTADAVLERCRQTIGSYKLPKDVRFVDAESLARNVSGKVERKALEILLAAEAEA